MSFKPEVQTGGDSAFYANSLAFATKEEAEISARDLMNRWLAVVDYRVVESDHPVSHQIVGGVLSSVTASPMPSPVDNEIETECLEDESSASLGM